MRAAASTLVDGGAGDVLRAQALAVAAETQRGLVRVAEAREARRGRFWAAVGQALVVAAGVTLISRLWSRGEVRA